MLSDAFHQSPSLSVILAFLIGYLAGSIPSGLILTRLAGLGDIRSIGSGNIGTTNVLRTGRKELAALTLIFDCLKGVIPVLAAHVLWEDEHALIAGFAAFIGHLFPVWLGFKGGKGVATYLGLLIAFYWPAAIAFIAVWVLVAVITRYSSASALAASLAGLGVVAFDAFYHGISEGYDETIYDYRKLILFAILTLLLWYCHRANIGRLLAGTESRIGKKA